MTGNWLAAAAVYAAMIEAPQLVLWGGDWSDGLEDAAHDSAGALAAAGIARRIEERGGLAAPQRRR